MKIQTIEDYSELELNLLQATYDSYNNHLVQNAIFLAERLHAEKPCLETKIILAECYLANGKPYKTSHILNEILAQPQYQLGYSGAKGVQTNKDIIYGVGSGIGVMNSTEL